MAKLEKFVEQTDWFWYSADLNDEQVAEWEAYEAGEADEPEWLWEINWDLTRSKTGDDDEEITLIK